MKLPALILIVALASCADASQPFGTDADAGGAAGHADAGVSGPDGRGGAGGMAGAAASTGGAGGASCAGCWQAGACVLPADQTIDMTGPAGAQCHRVPLACTGQAQAPCPINTAPAVQLAFRGTVAYCCPIDSCTYDACKPAVP